MLAISSSSGSKLLFVPAEYGYALDAARALTAAVSQVAIISNLPALAAPLALRFPNPATLAQAQAVLWLEPLAHHWQAELTTISQTLAPHSLLLILASRPLARALAERRSWSVAGLGLHPTGLVRLRHALSRGGFSLSAAYGFHTVSAIGLGKVSYYLEQMGRGDLADRANFAAHLYYQTSGPLAAFSTVAVLVARRREPDRI